MTDNERIELLKEVARVAPKEMRAVFCYLIRLQRGSASTKDGDAAVTFKSLTLMLLDDIKDASAVFALLDAMDVRDLGGLGPEVLIELCGSGSEWVCRRVICPDSDVPHVSQEGRGSTRAEAVARAFVQVFGGEA